MKNIGRVGHSIFHGSTSQHVLDQVIADRYGPRSGIADGNQCKAIQHLVVNAGSGIMQKLIPLAGRAMMQPCGFADSDRNRSRHANFGKERSSATCKFTF